MTNTVNQSFRAHAFQGVDLESCRLLGLNLNILESSSASAPIPTLRQAAAELLLGQSESTLQQFQTAHWHATSEARRAVDVFDRSLLRASSRGVWASDMLKNSTFDRIPVDYMIPSEEMLHCIRLIKLELVRPKLPSESGEFYVPLSLPEFQAVHAEQLAHECIKVRIGVRLPEGMQAPPRLQTHYSMAARSSAFL